MHLNSNLSKLVHIDTGDMAWRASGVPGLEVKRLEQFGFGSARTTALLRYEPGAVIPKKMGIHGAEFFVIKGEFSDEFGAYGAGTYLRYPNGFRHSVAGRDGVTLFCKTGHFLGFEVSRHVVRPADRRWELRSNRTSENTQLSVLGGEITTFARCFAQTRSSPGATYGGAEIFVVDGDLTMEIEGIRYECPAGAWIRFPHNAKAIRTSRSGAEYWVKTGHLSLT